MTVRISVCLLRVSRSTGSGPPATGWALSSVPFLLLPRTLPARSRGLYEYALTLDCLLWQVELGLDLGC